MTTQERAEREYPIPYPGSRDYEEMQDNQQALNLRAAYIKGAESRWISVEDVPLFTETETDWATTEAGYGEFIAAVPTNKGWWIRHCVIEDEVGLCVVGDDENEPAEWSMSDVTHWQPLPAPPNQNDNNG